MKKKLLLPLMALVLALSFLMTACADEDKDDDDDEDSTPKYEVPIEAYFKTMETGSEKEVKKVFCEAEIKKKIEEIIKKITSDKVFADHFKKDPVGAVEKVLGVDLPNDTIHAVIDGVKAKMTADTAKSMMNKAMDFLNSNKDK